MGNSYNKQIRIAIVGSHSVGKTTLAERLLSRNPSTIELITGIPRQIIARGFPMGKKSTVDAYVNYVRDQLKAERIAKNSEKRLVISDRTSLDANAYAHVNLTIDAPAVPDYFIDMLHEIWLREAEFYDLLVYIPVEFPMHVDGIRDIDEKYRNDVSEKIEQILVESGHSFITLRGSVKERVENLLSEMQQRFKYEF